MRGGLLDIIAFDRVLKRSRRELENCLLGSVLCELGARECDRFLIDSKRRVISQDDSFGDGGNPG